MGDMGDLLAYQEWSESQPYAEFNPRGYKPEPTWTTKDGTKIKLSEMETSHLVNSIKLLERSVARVPDYMVYTGNGEMAEQAVESENRHNEAIAEEMQDMIKLLIDELNSRLP
jgi:hypothetical protein